MIKAAFITSSAPAPINLNSVAMIDQNTGVAVGDNGVILRTVGAGGERWSDAQNNPNIGLHKLVSVSVSSCPFFWDTSCERLCVAVGVNTIMRSSSLTAYDACNTWSEVT